MTLGPLEYVVIGFEGNKFDGSIAREIEKVVESKVIRLVDVVMVAKDSDGEIVIIEMDAKDDPKFAAFSGLLDDRMGLFTPEDLATIAVDLPPDTAALALLFEHRWAEHIREAIDAAGGFLVGRAVIPPEVLAEVSAEIEAAGAISA